MVQKRALVVDNDRFYVELLAELLTQGGYEVLKAYDGLEALELAEQERPDLIFLDIVMPKVDGDRVCQYLKENPSTQPIPIVILSATTIEDRAKLLKIGADAYLAKGRVEELKANILAILKRLEAKEAGRPEEAILGTEKAHPRTLVKELLQLKRHHEALLRNMRDGVLNIDQEEKVTYVNPAGLEILGRLEREVIGRPVLQLFEAEDRGRIGRILEGLRQGDSKGGSLTLSYKDRTLLIDFVPAWEEERFSGLCFIIQDITPLARKIEELQTLNQKLMELDRFRSDFLAMITHNLRTPLASIKCGLEALSEEGTDREFGRRMLTIAQENADRMARLVDDILDLARIETGRLELHPELFELVPSIQAALKQVENLAIAKGIALTFSPFSPGEKGERLEVMADRRRIEQVLVNLLENAIKFTPAGGRVEVEAAELGGEILVWVADTGPGLSPDQTEKVFEKFYRGEGPGAGAGLGLYICKALVEGHGGRIWAEGEAGKGSRFCFTLPKRERSDPNRGRTKRHPGDPL